MVFLYGHSGLKQKMRKKLKFVKILNLVKWQKIHKKFFREKQQPGQGRVKNANVPVVVFGAIERVPQIVSVICTPHFAGDFT